MSDLHRAAFDGHTEIVRALLANGADVNAKNDNGYTPLQVAKDLNNIAIIKILEEWQDLPDTKEPDVD